jgi:hypothetical protein
MTITYRETKGTALLYGEVDENFRDLYEDTDLQRVLTNGNVSNLNITVNNVTITSPFTPLPGSTGNPGQIAWDSNYIYVCVAPNTWKRSLLSTWV